MQKCLILCYYCIIIPLWGSSKHTFFSGTLSFLVTHFKRLIFCYKHSSNSWRLLKKAPFVHVLYASLKWILPLKSIASLNTALANIFVIKRGWKCWLSFITEDYLLKIAFIESVQNLQFKFSCNLDFFQKCISHVHDTISRETFVLCQILSYY